MVGFPLRSATFTTRRMAERWGATIETEMVEGRHFRGTEAKRHTLNDAIDRYVKYHLPELKNGKMHRSVLPYWREQLGRMRLSEITSALLVEQRDKLKESTFVRARPGSKASTLKSDEKPQAFQRKPNTVNNYLRPLSRIFSLAKKEWHWTTVNPMQDVSLLKTSNERTRYLTEDERTRLLVETA